MTEARGSIDAGLATEFRRRLLDVRETLFRTIGATDEELAALRAPEPEGQPERAMSVSAATLLSRLEGQERHELDEITDALNRLDGGTYGVCQRCGHAIPIARLRAVPAARHCLGCQATKETHP